MAYRLMLKKIREDKGITQPEMANALEMKLSTYRAWEQGVTRITLENAVRCAEVLGCTPNDLCNWYEDHPAVAPPPDPAEAELLRCYSGLDSDRAGRLLATARDLTLAQGRDRSARLEGGLGQSA